MDSVVWIFHPGRRPSNRRRLPLPVDTRPLTTIHQHRTLQSQHPSLRPLPHQCHCHCQMRLRPFDSGSPDVGRPSRRRCPLLVVSVLGVRVLSVVSSSVGLVLWLSAHWVEWARPNTSADGRYVRVDLGPSLCVPSCAI